MKILLLIIAGLILFVWFVFRKKDRIESNTQLTADNSNEASAMKYDNLDAWKTDLKPLWKGSNIDIEFTYESRSGKKRRKVSLEKVAENSRKELYLVGYCYEKKEKRTFNIDNVATMILCKSKRYSHYDFLNDVVGIDATGYSFRC